MSHFYLMCPSIRKNKEKKIEKKINIDLAILPSHDTVRRETMKTILKEEEIKEEKSGVREWMKDDDDEIGNIMDPCYKL